MNFRKSAANFFMRWNASVTMFCGFAVLLTAAWLWRGNEAAAAQIPPYRSGDIFVSTLDGTVYRFDQPTGTLMQTLDTGIRRFMSGLAFDKQGNLYATVFGGERVAKFDPSGNLTGNFGSGYGRFPKSVIVDPDGNVFVGSVDGDNDVLKFSPSGTLLDRFDVQTELRGSDWIDLAGDRCTLYYTSEGTSVKRYNVCTKTQLPDFVTNLPYFGVQGIRLLPDGGMLVADNDEILRLNSTGNIVRRYDVAGINCWFTMNLNADNKTFWSADYDTGFIHKFDLESGALLSTIYTGQRLMGLAILGELTAVPTPTPVPTATPTPTATPLAAADLLAMNSVSPSVVTKGSLVTFTAMVINNGPGTATNVRVNNWLPRGLTLLSCTASAGKCEVLPTDGTGEMNLLGAGQKITYTFVARVDDCIATESNGRALNMFKVSSDNPDPNMDNNLANTFLDLAPPAPKVTLASNSFNFGQKTLRRETDTNPPFIAFTVENSGCLPLTLSSALSRTGADTTNGKITNADDSATFPIAVVNQGVPTFLTRNELVTIVPGTTQGFRLYFNPRIPAAAGKITGLNAVQVMPDVLTSSLRLTTNAATATGGPVSFTFPITAGITTEHKMINPLATTLSPLVVMARNADEYSVEFSVHDSNMDVFCATYEFLDGSDKPVGEGPTFYLDEDITKANMVRGQSFTIVKKFSGANKRPEVKRVRVTVHDREGRITVMSSDIGTANGRVVNVSAASFAASSLAAESIVAAFGQHLATGTGITTSLSLPMELAGTQVSVTDSNSIERLAPLFFVAPGQVNYLLPPGLPLGPATVTVAAADGTLSTGTVMITDSAPALFTADASGLGLAAGVALRVKANGQQIYEPLARYDETLKRVVAVPIEMSDATDRVFLVLFGTGIRHYRTPVRPVRASLAGLAVPVLYAGSQGGYAGLDQVNVLLPSTLRGRGEVEVDLTVDGRAANPVRIVVR